MFSSILMVLLAFCVSGGFSHAETRARSCAARFCFEKGSKGRDVGAVSRSRLFLFDGHCVIHAGDI